MYLVACINILERRGLPFKGGRAWANLPADDEPAVLDKHLQRQVFQRQGPEELVTQLVSKLFSLSVVEVRYCA